MAQNFLACDREQSFLFPPDVRDWLPANHLAWFVIDAVGVIDTSQFYAAYRADGHGRAAYEPSMVIALLLYCWSRSVRSSRAIERACAEDVACRVIAGQQRPDHATPARFVVRHENALGELFGQVLELCADAGLATVGIVAIDGTKVHANAHRDRTMTYRSRGVMKNGRRFGGAPKPYTPPATPAGKINRSDPDSRLVHGMRGYIQGYNAQAVCNEQYLILAAEVMTASPDFGHLLPMLNPARGELAAAGVNSTPEVVLADAGYWHLKQMNEITGDGIPVLIAPDSSRRASPRPGWTGSAYDFMRAALATERGNELYRQRKQLIEPIFGHTKHNRRFTRVSRRGRAAARTEWRLIATTHNLLKLHQHFTATVT